MKQLFILLILLINTSCMTNDDWYTHDVVLTQDTITIDGEESSFATFEIGEDNIGVTIYIAENVESFTWHFDIFNDDESYGSTITGTETGVAIYIPHDFNKYPIIDEMKGTTYVMESSIHFMTNIIKV